MLKNGDFNGHLFVVVNSERRLTESFTLDACSFGPIVTEIAGINGADSTHTEKDVGTFLVINGFPHPIRVVRTAFPVCTAQCIRMSSVVKEPHFCTSVIGNKTNSCKNIVHCNGFAFAELCFGDSYSTNIKFT